MFEMYAPTKVFQQTSAIECSDIRESSTIIIKAIGNGVFSVPNLKAPTGIDNKEEKKKRRTDEFKSFVAVTFYPFKVVEFSYSFHVDIIV